MADGLGLSIGDDGSAIVATNEPVEMLTVLAHVLAQLGLGHAAQVGERLHVQDFEAGLGSWTVGQVPSNPATWDPRDWTLDASLPHGRAGTGVYGPDPAIGNCSSDLDNGVIYLQSPPINIPPSSPAAVRLNFDHWVSMENRWDGGSVRYSTDGVNFSLIPSNAFLFNAYNTTLYESGQGNDNPRAGEAAFETQVVRQVDVVIVIEVGIFAPGDRRPQA